MTAGSGGSGPPAPSLTLAAGGVLLGLTPLRRLSPAAPDAWDRDRLRVAVTVRAPPFAGAFETVAWGREFRTLRALLAELHAAAGRPGAAPVRRDFALLEGTVRLGLELDRRGGLTIDAEVCADPAGPAFLRTAIEADQSYLPRWVAELDAILEVFPPVPATG